MAANRRPGKDSGHEDSGHEDSGHEDSAHKGPPQTFDVQGDKAVRTSRPSTSRPSTSRPSTSRPSTSRPSTSKPSTGEIAGIAQPSDTLTSTERLLDEHFDTVFRYAYRLTGNATAAEDVAQEVFLRAFRNLHQLRDAGRAKGWLLVITRNEFARWCKKYAPKPSLETMDAAEEPAEPESVAVDREDWVQQSLEQLPLDYRTVVVMFYFEQLSYTEIAQQLQIPLGTVMSRLNRGKSHLKKALTALAEPNA